jgi:hypothetical protein
MEVMAVSGCASVWGTRDGTPAEQRFFAFTRVGRMQQLERPKTAPTVGLSKIRCSKIKIIFQITFMFLYYRE